MEFQPLKYIFHPGSDENANTLLLLHGTGGDETDLIPLADKFGKGINTLSLRGNVSEHGMPRFFKRLGMGIFDEEDLRFRTEEMVQFLIEISATEGFDPGKIIALGYSNGANIAGAALINYPDFLSGAILLRPMQPFKVLPSFESIRKTPVFMSSGKFDPTVNPSDTHSYVNDLKLAGFTVEHVNLNTSHNLTQEDISLAVEWYAKNYK